MISTDLTQEKIITLAEYFEYVPYDVTKQELYNAETLYAGYDLKHQETAKDCYDARVYEYFIKTGKHAFGAKESLARSLHDHSINHALSEFLMHYDLRSIVGIMGGHGLKRTDPMYREIVLVSKRLTEEGFLMISGGGPGAMEATHLGAWLAGYTTNDVEAVLHRLAVAPVFTDEKWLESAFLIIRDYPQTRYRSLGLPTWLYGHEPSTPLATHIAKYFENSIREDNILTLAFGGIIYSPGSAGTMQEIFQDAVQNHYLSYGIASPMIFLGTHFWGNEMPIYPFLKHMVKRGRYKNLLLTLTDSNEEIIKTLLEFRNTKKDE